MLTRNPQDTADDLLNSDTGDKRSPRQERRHPSKVRLLKLGLILLSVFGIASPAFTKTLTLDDFSSKPTSSINQPNKLTEVLIVAANPVNIANGALIKGSGNAVFLMNNGQRRHIPNPTTFDAMRLNWNILQTVSDPVLNSIPLGQALPAISSYLIKGNGNAVFLMDNGNRRHIPNPTAFDAMRLNWNTLQTVSDPVLNSIPLGQALPAISSYLIKGNGDAVYLMENGLRRHIPNPATFDAMRLNWNALQVVSDPVLNSIPLGQTLPSIAPPNNSTNFEAFVNFARGQWGIARLDTSSYKGQCVSLIARYLQEVYLTGSNKTRPIALDNGGGTAQAVANQFSAYFLPTTRDGLPKRGAVASFPQLGHTAIVMESRTLSNGQRQMRIMDSNGNNKAPNTQVKEYAYWINIPNGTPNGYGNNIYWTNPR